MMYKDAVAGKYIGSLYYYFVYLHKLYCSAYDWT